MRYFLDHEQDKFVPVPVYVDVKTGMLVQRFDGPREGETPWSGGQDEGNVGLAYAVGEAADL